MIAKSTSPTSGTKQVHEPSRAEIIDRLRRGEITAQQALTELDGHLDEVSVEVDQPEAKVRVFGD